AFFRATAPAIDRFVARLTNGEHTVSKLLLPTLILTTIGRRSGLAREHPLVYLEDAGDFVVVGSNWGQEHHPAWTHNLLANPDATVTIDGATTPVRGRQVTGEEGEQLFQRFVDMAPNYGNYGDWSGGRDTRVFRLTPR
ncbi:MAG: nitroreductase/quinone reductase family protein, partial [Nitriliruptorales bacterium]|nr:nitroreductase/quinone reductase family protein [Nitriliruptorales bacterium]